MDARTPLDDNEYQLPFRFTGKLISVAFQLDPSELAQADRLKAAKALAAAHD